ncbi:GNAT family acetyltransferase [Pontibacillus chungwhensis BH030062]|uniref:GNAT family acetyltransferase n=1 Tax=Pontibacillus chungwhensis BH030062 TaxID=1385513 RepID=A0A0A2UQ68_9BACI|nr:GNAT family N-acetyltransferase [Pontibacillus chungwhensis]KGP90104.1 GNAT family acetyltransferase [Pontibacillus chungwhensis BH030062]
MIRKAAREDLDRIMEIVEASKLLMEATGSDQWDSAYPLYSDYESDFEQGRLFVYEEGESVCGVACFNEQEPEHYSLMAWSKPDGEKVLLTQRLAVDPEVRGKGIAESFYHYVEQLAGNRGIQFLKTDTYSLNPAAQRVFQKAGYTYIGEWSTPERKAPFYFYEKNLKQG